MCLQTTLAAAADDDDDNNNNNNSIIIYLRANLRAQKPITKLARIIKKSIQFLANSEWPITGEH
jgi:hypothetical protein